MIIMIMIMMMMIMIIIIIIVQRKTSLNTKSRGKSLNSGTLPGSKEIQVNIFLRMLAVPSSAIFWHMCAEGLPGMVFRLSR